MNKAVSMEEMLPLITEQLENGGSASFRIHGISMMPMLKDRTDSVRIIRPDSEPKKYDIILYRRSDGTFILHRIVGLKDDGFVCRGDNQTTDEYPVRNGDIIGVVSEYTRNGKQKRFGCFSQTVYSRIWVNTVFLRRIKAKIFKKGN